MKRILASIALFAATLWFVSNVAAQTPASIQIVEPLDRRNVPDKNAQVTVEITGVAANDGHYWELWVDEEPIVGVRDGSNMAVVERFKPTGPHRLKAVLFNAQGNPLAASNVVLVLAAPVDERKPLFNREMMAPIIAVFTALVALLIVASVWFNRRSSARKRVETEMNVT